MAVRAAPLECWSNQRTQILPKYYRPEVMAHQLQIKRVKKYLNLGILALITIYTLNILKVSFLYIFF